eukprot:jgi/Tetstr1/465998/TSEL_010589.t1
MSEASPTGGNGLSYADAGVDIDAGNALVKRIKPLVKATARPGADGEIGGFGGVFDSRRPASPIPCSSPPTTASAPNSRLPSTARSTTRSASISWRCASTIWSSRARSPCSSSTITPAARSTSRPRPAVVAGIAEGCRRAGCALIGGETAEMPGMYGDKDYDLAGFAVGAAERGNLLPRGDAVAGDVLLALGSSGVHSNGYSLVRKIVERSGLDWSADAPFAPGTSLGAALMTPTRIYVKSLLAALKAGPGIKALAHITGGGLPENLPRVLPDTLAARIDLTALSVPPVFGWLASTGGVAQSEMLRTFNCGVGMVVAVSADTAEAVAEVLRAEGETVSRIGTLEPRAAGGDAVIFDGALAL